MKKLEAIVSPAELRRLKAALTSDGVAGLTVSEVKSIGGEGHLERYRGARYAVNWDHKVKLELLARDDDVDYLIGVIRSATRADQGAHDNISVTTVYDAVRIRTGQRGHDAI